MSEVEANLPFDKTVASPFSRAADLIKLSNLSIADVEGTMPSCTSDVTELLAAFHVPGFGGLGGGESDVLTQDLVVELLLMDSLVLSGMESKVVSTEAL